MEMLVVKPGRPLHGPPGESQTDNRWFAGMVACVYEDGGIGTPVTSKNLFAIRIPGVSLAAARQYLKDNGRDIDVAVYGLVADPVTGEYPQEKRRRIRLNFNSLPQAAKDDYAAGQRDFTFTKEQVLSYLEDHG